MREVARLREQHDESVIKRQMAALREPLKAAKEAKDALEVLHTCVFGAVPWLSTRTHAPLSQALGPSR